MATFTTSEPAPLTYPRPDPPPRKLTIAGQQRSVARSRAFVADALGPGHPAAEVAVLLVSEVVTNAVLHSDSGGKGGRVTVAVTDTGCRLRVEVADAGSACSVPSVRKDQFTCTGHGLFLVDSLSDEWGFSCGDGGTTVWFCLKLT